MLLGTRLQSSHTMGNKYLPHLNMGQKIDSQYNRKVLQIQPRPITHSQIERPHINNH